MDIHIPRSVTEHGAGDKALRALADFRNRGAYVLLGEPGAGKTECFRAESQQPGCQYLTAREFLRRDDPSSWSGKALFIDGLDEIRAGAADGRPALDGICRQLERLGGPRFRLSCREADWLGALDREALVSLAPAADLAVLHLEPLTEEEALRITAATAGDGQFDFLGLAKRVGLGDLLGNPQNLKMLLASVRGGHRPKSRSEIFDLACRQLAVEPNRNHQEAVGDALAPVDALVDAAGLLCAVLLLADKAGVALIPAAADEAYPSLTEFKPAPTPLPLKSALGSRLFAASDERRRTPVHRIVAEYLAARYLSGIVQTTGLSWRRVAALLAGSDGKPVAALRGLWAWLATFLDDEARRHLIETDPVAVVLYGDARALLTDDRISVLHALHRAAQRYPWILGGRWAFSPFGALASKDMEDAFRSVLADPARDEATQVLTNCVLEAIRHGEPMPSLARALEAVARDESRGPWLRRNALRAWLHVTPPETDSKTFRGLLADVHSGRVGDPDDELLGILLETLYPDHVSANEIFDFLRKPKQENLLGQYHWFWDRNLLIKTRLEDIPVLLDQLASRPTLHPGIYWEDTFHGMLGTLVEWGLISHGTNVAAARLFDWLGIGLDKHGGSRVQDHREEITGWLTAHPDCVKAVLRVGLRRAQDRERFTSWDWYRRLHGAKLPDDFGLWALSEATHIGRDDIAKAVFEQAIATLWRGEGQEGLSLERLEDWVSDHTRFRSWFDEILTCPVSDSHYEHVRHDSRWKARQEREKREWLAYFRTHQTAMREGKAPPAVLDGLAVAYFGHLRSATGNSPRERFLTLLDNDSVLVDDALAALRQAPYRPDLPVVQDIVSLSLRNRRHLISYACLAGALEDADLAHTLPDDALEKLVAMQLAIRHGERAPWFDRLKREKPELVARILVTDALAGLKAGHAYRAGMSALAYDDDYRDVAARATQPLLEGFPLRARKDQLGGLGYLLKAGLRHLPEEEFLSVVDDRLGVKSLDPAQRTLWLLAGFLVAPKRFMGLLETHVGRSQVRAQLLAGFLPNRGESWPFRKPLPAGALAWLVGLLGARCAPYRLEAGFGAVTPAMDMADLVKSLVAQLGADPSEQASSTLEDLTSRRNLMQWQEELRHARHGQATARREAEFRHPEPAEILAALRNREPACPSDLAALTLEHLDDLAAHIRDGVSNAYRRFWNKKDDNRTPSHPNSENDCRDILLDDLAARLRPQGLEVGKEGYFVEDKRADLVVTFKDWRLPIEIKKDSHLNLWRSLRDQLIGQYTRGPDTGGYGVYLALWFGSSGMPASPSGHRPKNAAELREQLTGLLEPEERHRIAIRVINCSWPR